MLDHSSDLELLARIRAGEESALAHLLGTYWNPLCRYATDLLGLRDAAEDVVQEAFVRMWQRRESWALEGSVRGLLFRITRNLALDERKRGRVRRRAHRLLQSEAPAGEPAGESRDLERAAEAAIEALPRRRRDVFLLARHHGLSYREIAETLDLSPQTVANQMSLALRDLRKALAPFLDLEGPPQRRGLGPA